ncbi:MAG: hypothetical protein ACPG44_09195 [Polaribacter sp.]
MSDIDKLLGVGHRSQRLADAFLEWHGVPPSENIKRFNEYVEVVTHLSELECVTFYEEHIEILLKGKNILEMGGFSAYLDYLEKPSKNQEALVEQMRELVNLQVNQLKKDLNLKLSENQNLFYQQSIEKLQADMSAETKVIEERLKNAQLEFFKTSIEKNRTYMLVAFVSLGISLLSLLATVFNYFK